MWCGVICGGREECRDFVQCFDLVRAIGQDLDDGVLADVQSQQVR